VALAKKSASTLNVLKGKNSNFNENAGANNIGAAVNHNRAGSNKVPIVAYSTKISQSTTPMIPQINQETVR